MALSRVKVFVDGEVLFAADVNAEFDNIINNGLLLGFPATALVDLNGQTLSLDGDGTTILRAATDDLFELVFDSNTIFTVDGTASNVVNGLEVEGKATGTYVQLKPTGDANQGLDLRTSGIGFIRFDGSNFAADVQAFLGYEVFAR